MADETIKSESLKMLCTGFALGVANDLQPKGKFNFLQNIRVLKEGILEARPFIEPFLTLSPDPNSVAHTIRTIVNKSNASLNRIVGAGSKLFTGSGMVLNEKDSGYSGKPFFTVDFRPEQSIEAYLYIADENKFVKVSVSNLLKDVGITVPYNAPNWQLVSPQRKIIDKITTGSVAAWVPSGAIVPANVGLENMVNTTVTACMQDGSLPGFVSIIPASSLNIPEGSVVTNAATDYIVEEVCPAPFKAGIATIAKISYDVGVVGMCTIVLSLPSAEIKRNSVILFAGEYVVVKDVTRDSNNIPSIRASTLGVHAVGEAATGVDSFRVFTGVNWAAASAITNEVLAFPIPTAGISGMTRTFDVNMLNTGIKPLTLDDVFHINLVGDTATFTEIQIQLDVSDGTFTTNYFYFPISPNFFSASQKQTTPTLSVLQQSLQREQLIASARNIYTHIQRNADSGGYDPGVTYDDVYAGVIQRQIESGLAGDGGGYSSETTTGANQWTSFNINLRDFIKVGSDTTKTLKDVKAIRISVNASAAGTFKIDSLWVGGSGVLDTTTEGFLPYNYVYRLRDPSTRVPSNWSPPLRTGIRITRSGVSLSFPEANANYPATYNVDIARVGGSLGDFRIIGTVKNDGSSFVDLISDRLAADNPLAGRFSEHGATDAIFDFYKPFALLDTPKKGTCNVIGTKLTTLAGSDALNVTYPRGVQIIVNGQINSFYTRPLSATQVDLETDMGSLVGVSWEIPEPLLTGQPLPVIFGPAGEGNLSLFIFGIGDKNAAGTVYWLDGNSPDTHSDINRLEITSPSEPLIVGVIYDGFPFIWTNQRSFMLQPSVDSQGNFSFVARENANSRGVFCKTGICVSAAFIYFLSENADGIYRVQGNGNPECITSALWKSFFRNNGEEPEPTKLVDGTIIYPPDFTKPNEIRFFSTQDYIYFRFVDTIGNQAALVYSVAMGDFVSYDSFKDGIANSFYREEVESSRNILLATDGHTISRYGMTAGYEPDTQCIIIPFASDGGDSRSTKEYKEHMVDAINGVGGYKYTLYFNNGELGIDGFQAPVGTSIFVLGDNTGKRVQQILGLTGNEFGPLARNYTTVYRWRIGDGPKFFEDKIYYIPKGDIIGNRPGEVEDGGDIGNKLWQGVIFQANTFGVNKVLDFYDDRNALKATLTINHNGEQTLSYAFPVPFISHTIKRTSEDQVSWILEKELYVFDREPEEAKVWEGEFNTHDLTGLILAKRMAIAYRSLSAFTMTLRFDDGTVQVYNFASSGGEYAKFFFYLIAKKWKACKYRFESAQDFMLYKPDCEVWMKSLSSNTPFGRFKPFGGPSRVTEILI